jgi:hypothetical protein
MAALQRNLLRDSPVATTKKRPTTYQPILTLPPLPHEEFLALRDNIAVNGVLVPILVDESRRIIDGTYRKRIADELGYASPEIVQTGLTEEEKRTLARALNLARRHLTTAAKRQLIADQLAETPGRSNRWVGKQLGVSHPTVGSVRDELEATGKIYQFDRTVGEDGKQRPARPFRNAFEARQPDDFYPKPPLTTRSSPHGLIRPAPRGEGRLRPAGATGPGRGSPAPCWSRCCASPPRSACR